MKTLIRSTTFIIILLLGMVAEAQQRVISGTIYREGKPAAGINVELHRSSQRMVMTSFDGKYEITGDDKSRWIRFTYIDESKRVDLPLDTDKFDFLFDGVEPLDGGNGDAGGINNKTHDQLIAEGDREYMNSLSIYTEFYRQQDYKTAYTNWKELYLNYPKSRLNIYIQGAIIYESFIEQASNPVEKATYLDSLMRLYDARMRHFGQKGFVSGRKGATWLKYSLPPAEDISNDELAAIYKKGYDLVEFSVNDLKEEAEIPVLLLLMQTSRSLFSLSELPKETVARNYEVIMDLLNKKQAANPAEEGLAEVRGLVETLFTNSGAADCETLVAIYSAQCEERNDDIEFITSMLRRLARANCDNSDLFFRASERMYELDPSAEAAFNMARMFVRKGDNVRAKDYYRQAMEQETDRDLLENYYFEYAAFVFSIDNNLQESRNYAKRALEINPNNCRANMLVGDIYVAASRSFSNDDFEKSAVFWVAVDYFTKARSGEECVAEASQRINTYRQYYPNKEAAFFLSIMEGSNYTVKGWINETTKVRF